MIAYKRAVLASRFFAVKLDEHIRFRRGYDFRIFYDRNDLAFVLVKPRRVVLFHTFAKHVVNVLLFADIDYAISADEAEVETLDEKRNQLESVKERLDEYNKKINIYKATIEFLETAENNLKDRYISPVRDNFLYYANMLEETLGEKITVDQDFNIMFERGGENRSDKHLSAGQRSLCALCFRLALVNKMYETEKPFILMDDPFVHLDERHLERTRKLVRSLSETNQIIYFSCHKSRKISV